MRVFLSDLKVVGKGQRDGPLDGGNTKLPRASTVSFYIPSDLTLGSCVSVWRLDGHSDTVLALLLF